MRRPDHCSLETAAAAAAVQVGARVLVVVLGKVRCAWQELEVFIC